MLDAEPERSNPTASPRMLRQFAGAWLIVFLALAGKRWFVGHQTTSALVYLILALGVGGLGLIRPMRVRPLFALAMALSLPIGLLMSRIVIFLLFFVVFTPVGWLFRLFRRDSLRLRRRGDVATYWKDFPASDDVRAYFRQS
jgi:hypothetical protein